MEKTNPLSDLLMAELADLLNAEHQLVEALPKIAEASQSPVLKSALEDYLKASRNHIKELQDIFSNDANGPQKLNGKAMQGLIAESRDLINKKEMSQARDTAIIWLVQRMEQYEMAEYKKLREHAADLGHTKIVALLTAILNEERVLNLHLNELAQGSINVEATSKPKSGGFYIPEGRFVRKGIKRKPKSMDVSRFVSEGNPNAQNPEEEGDLS